MSICECCDLQLRAPVIVVTAWGMFCSQTCADAARYYDERTNDRDYDYKFISLGE